MFQTKEQDKTPEDQLSEVEISNHPEKECRVIIVKMIQDFRKKNGGTDQEDIRNVKQRARIYKKQTNRDEQYNS